MRDVDVCPYLNIDNDMGKTIPYCEKCGYGTICDHCISKPPGAVLGVKPMASEEAAFLILLMAMSPKPDSNINEEETKND